MVIERRETNRANGGNGQICPNCGQSEMMPDADAAARNMFWCRECGLTANAETLQNMAAVS